MSRKRYSPFQLSKPGHPNCLARTPDMTDTPFQNFHDASRATLAFLHQRLGFALWMVTRTEGEDWIVLHAEDHGYGVAAGNVFQWADSFCSEMVKGNGPRMAHDSGSVAAYRGASIGRQVPIQAYVGVPLTRSDGSLFGTLCAIDPAIQPATIAQEQGLVELLAALLSALLQGELKAADEARRNERLALEAATDVLTGLSNRRAWNELLAREEDRSSRYGHPAAVLVVDIDGLKRINDSAGHAAGDALIVRTAQALRQAARQNDVVARLGGDEFALLAIECDRAGAEALLVRTRLALREAGVTAAVGMATRDPASGLQAAWECADQAMYRDKRSHGQHLPPPEKN